MKKKKLALFCLILSLILSASIQMTSAYFTTFAEAKGGYAIHLGDTEVEEEFYDWTKHVVITSSEDAQPIYVRAIALAGSEYQLTYSGDGWTLGDDGYYYYDQILYAGEQTTELLVRIDNIPEDPAENESFNVVVLYESTPVQYDDDGNPYADWGLGGDEG